MMADDGKPQGDSRQPVTLPPLRQDLEILEGAVTANGAHSWVIYDPLQHRYFQIDRETKEILSLWKEGMQASELARLAHEMFAIAVDERQIQHLIGFIRASHLSEASSADWQRMVGNADSGRGTIWAQLIHNYLFLRLPLVQPQRWLRAMLPLVAPFYTRIAALVILFAGLTGLYLTSRQWDVFIHTFQSFMSWEGAATFGVTIVFVKALHELGHAFTAVRYGCHVPTMGIAFVVMVPMMYTDVTDAWRLRSRRQRFWIGAAGIVVEVALAAIALLLWAFLSEGVIRSAAFSVATTSLIMTLAVNLSPFMRFDGYYLLSDLLGVENLHTRAFALGRWKFRRILFGSRARPPETLSPALTNGLVVFAWGVWIYRLIVFTGIAVLVYQYFFKLLGLVLFTVEIWFFVLRPVVQEIWGWRKFEAAGFSAFRTIITASAAIVATLAFILPWSGRVDVPAVLEASDEVQIFPPKPARLKRIAVTLGQEVRAGDVLAELELPDLDNEIETTSIKLAEIRRRLGRALSDQADREEYLVLSNEQVMLQMKLNGLAKEKAELTLRAPAAGRLLQLDAKLQPGRWLAKDDLIAIVGGKQSLVVLGYASEEDVGRLHLGAPGRFIANDPSQPAIAVRLTEVERASASSIDLLILASVYGGPISVEPDAQRRLIPVTAQFPVSLKPVDGIRTINHVVAGRVVLSDEQESQLMRVFRQVMRVVIRESGF